MLSILHVGPLLAPVPDVRAVCWLVALLLPGCFYLDPINVPPEARIVRIGDEPVHVGRTVRLSAQASHDEDGDELRYDWVAATCAGCPSQAADQQMEFSVTILKQDTLRVRLWVFDPHGARGEAVLELPVANRAPAGLLTVPTLPNPDGTYTVTRPIVFAAAGSDPDGDAVTFAFALHPPPQSNPDRVVFERLDERTYHLEPDVPGRWEVAVTITDALGLATTLREAVMVAADAPPCIAATTPAWSSDTRLVLLRSAGPRRFAVESVRDDLDAHPGTGIHFRWLVAAPGSSVPVEIAGRDLPELVLDPADLDPGDVLGVRVEIRDRNARPLPCAAEQAACSIGGDACLQRLTWTVEVR
jgi:hypothetical protein